MRERKGRFQPSACGGILLLIFAISGNAQEKAGKVTLLRVPDGGIQPQAMVDAKGIVHLIYFKGDLARGDIFYARSEDGEHFSRPNRVNSEPQRNLIQQAFGLDGGGSVAADGAGNVFVSWHAPEPGTRGEENRCVWVARSTDEGRTFGREERANPDATGACGCCGMRAFADRQGTVFVLYRSATEKVHRDMHVLVSTDHGGSFRTVQQRS
jgi:hypothetical protein